MRKNRRSWAGIAFALYCLLMLWLLFGQRWGQNAGSLNLKFGDTLWRYIWVLKYSADGSQRIHAIVNLFGNVVMFVPLGLLTPCLWRKIRKFGWHLLAMTATIVAIELLQLLTRLGTCDVDDLMLNLIGTAIGLGLFKLWQSINRRGGS